MPAGTYNTRYEITFKNGTLGVDGLAKNNFVVFQDNTTKNLTISNPSQLEIASCGLYDVAGKLIFHKNQLGTELSYLFPTSNLSDGIYIVKLASTDKIEMGQKIIIKN